MKKINELFYSIQGEGTFTGTPMIFIRFSGCNLSCHFCDTYHCKGKEMSIREIIAFVQQIPAKKVCLTGGEPTLQLNEKNDELIQCLKAIGKEIHIETNGTNEIPKGIDFATISPKIDTIHNVEKINCPHEVKIIYPHNNPNKFLKKYPNANYYYLQPMDVKNEDKKKENIKKTVDFIKNNPIWNLSLQTHKLINIL